MAGPPQDVSNSLPSFNASQGDDPDQEGTSFRHSSTDTKRQVTVSLDSQEDRSTVHKYRANDQHTTRSCGGRMPTPNRQSEDKMGEGKHGSTHDDDGPTNRQTMTTYSTNEQENAFATKASATEAHSTNISSRAEQEDVENTLQSSYATIQTTPSNSKRDSNSLGVASNPMNRVEGPPDADSTGTINMNTNKTRSLGLQLTDVTTDTMKDKVQREACIADTPVEISLKEAPNSDSGTRTSVILLHQNVSRTAETTIDKERFVDSKLVKEEVAQNDTSNVEKVALKSQKEKVAQDDTSNVEKVTMKSLKVKSAVENFPFQTEASAVRASHGIGDTASPVIPMLLEARILSNTSKLGRPSADEKTPLKSGNDTSDEVDKSLSKWQSITRSTAEGGMFVVTFDNGCSNTCNLNAVLQLLREDIEPESGKHHRIQETGATQEEVETLPANTSTNTPSNATNAMTMTASTTDLQLVSAANKPVPVSTTTNAISVTTVPASPNVTSTTAFTKTVAASTTNETSTTASTNTVAASTTNATSTTASTNTVAASTTNATSTRTSATAASSSSRSTANQRPDDAGVPHQTVNRRSNMGGEGGQRSSSRFHGVSWHNQRKRWRAYIYLSPGRQKYLGTFEDQYEAARKYDEAVKAHNLRSPLNFVNGQEVRTKWDRKGGANSGRQPLVAGSRKKREREAGPGPSHTMQQPKTSAISYAQRLGQPVQPPGKPYPSLSPKRLRLNHLQEAAPVMPPRGLGQLFPPVITGGSYMYGYLDGNGMPTALRNHQIAETAEQRHQSTGRDPASTMDGGRERSMDPQYMAQMIPMFNSHYHQPTQQTAPHNSPPQAIVNSPQVPGYLAPYQQGQVPSAPVPPYQAVLHSRGNPYLNSQVHSVPQYLPMGHMFPQQRSGANSGSLPAGNVQFNNVGGQQQQQQQQQIPPKPRSGETE